MEIIGDIAATISAEDAIVAYRADGSMTLRIGSIAFRIDRADASLIGRRLGDAAATLIAG